MTRAGKTLVFLVYYTELIIRNRARIWACKTFFCTFEISGKMFNVEFLLTLAICADIYNLYGAIINVVQEVNVLPYERLSKFEHEVNKMEIMKNCLKDHKKCIEVLGEDTVKEKGCHWKCLHEDIASVKKNSTIRNIQVYESTEVPAAGLQSLTRYFSKLENQNRKINTVDKVYKKAEDLLGYIHEHLNDEVYDQDDKNLISKTETVTDVAALIRKLNVPGASWTKLAVTECPKFILAVQSIPVSSMQEVSGDILMCQFENHLKNLQKLSASYSEEDLDSKVIIKTLRVKQIL